MECRWNSGRLRAILFESCARAALRRQPRRCSSTQSTVQHKAIKATSRTRFGVPGLPSIELAIGSKLTRRGRNRLHSVALRMLAERTNLMARALNQLRASTQRHAQASVCPPVGKQHVVRARCFGGLSQAASGVEIRHCGATGVREVWDLCCLARSSWQLRFFSGVR